MFGGRKPENGLGQVPFRVMLHAGQSEEILDFGGEQYPEWIDDYEAGFPHPRGAVVAVVTLAGQHKASHHVPASQHDLDEYGWSYCKACCEASQWAMYGPGEKPMWHWEIGAVQVLETPVPAKGRLGLWKPDQSVVDAVEAQLESETS